MKLKRCDQNPILSPVPGSSWESLCVCNPAASFDGKKVSLLYRAAPADAEHPIYFGLAESTDGFRFKRVSAKPVFGPSADGFDAGCVEDPRIVRMGKTFYVTYAARLFAPGRYFDKVPLTKFVPAPYKSRLAPAMARLNLTRTGLASTTDFKTWHRLGPITPATVDDRDAILFPEQISGRFFMTHRPVSWIGKEYGCSKPSIWLSSSTDLLDWNEHRVLAQPAFDWESEKIGGSTPPIRTPKGWLMLYHGVDKKKVYRVGAMLLDLKNPAKVIARLPTPILEPETDYEKNGLVKNVVFPCGNIVIKGILFVYYGGADTCCCVATIKLNDLVKDLLKHRV
ncbi:MAG TPA: glycosidase [Verrucomicrobia bacterium]|nr:MAG: glycosidase [Lentisphaerae bacterium GWF2_57_35]HBA83409.1 glycosidase [Verrucomicrobiota bacterium]